MCVCVFHCPRQCLKDGGRISTQYYARAEALKHAQPGRQTFLDQMVCGTAFPRHCFVVSSLSLFSPLSSVYLFSPLQMARSTALQGTSLHPKALFYLSLTCRRLYLDLPLPSP